ncbi:putative RNA-directed DNA polymerase from transposon BS [Stylophora pistillata]|uniref:Putative RNA-directed DNA polymerase from transposon BS n=1 Tax=Stylophora pistillata TaxID=50429 RepID=A0A2B4RIN3_STYPI|nr:putative RNA-directed DNA polymerase from transposon BS [Stylophora pistillata]
MTLTWKKAIRNKWKHAILFAKNRTPDNMELKRKYRNICTRERRKAIIEYWFAKSEELKSKPREFYNAFRPFINRKTKESTLISLNTKEGIIVKDQCEVADQLVNYFTTDAVSIVGDNAICITEENHDNQSSVKALREAYLGTHFEFSRVGKDQVQKALENINPNKSCGWDPGAPSKLLKNVACGIAPSLMTLYNSCIELGRWPCAWKMGEWTPVFKKRLVEDWKSSVDRKELVYILSTDLSKAFDFLSHSLIVKKFEAYGIGQNSLNLLRSYFDNRLNRVKIKGVTSDWKRMVLGWPQGSSLGPLLWNLFQNDMSFHINNATLSMYAGDHQMYVTREEA